MWDTIWFIDLVIGLYDDCWRDANILYLVATQRRSIHVPGYHNNIEWNIKNALYVCCKVVKAGGGIYIYICEKSILNKLASTLCRLDIPAWFSSTIRMTVNFLIWHPFNPHARLPSPDILCETCGDKVLSCNLFLTVHWGSSVHDDWCQLAAYR